MRGGFLHTSVLITSIENCFRGLGAEIHRESLVYMGNRIGFIDLVVVLGSLVIACEAELSADRVISDIAKAMSAEADLLLIVVPTTRVARAVRRRLAPAARILKDAPPICVLPLGTALQQLGKKGRFVTDVNVPQTFNHNARWADSKACGNGEDKS